MAILLFFIGGCKKELTSPESIPKISNLGLSGETVDQLKNKKLRFSPSIKVTVESRLTKSASNTPPKEIERMESILREDQAKKKSKPAITTSSVDFSVTLNGSYYNCYAEVDDPGATNWWLINTYTWVMTPLGQTSGNSIAFYVNKPDLYGSYRLWGENVSTSGGGYTGYQSMGDPYTGVSISSGILEFTDNAAFTNLNERLEQAYENHSAAFYDGLSSSLTDVQVNDYADSQGFDDLLPLKEFENYWGLYSLRQRIESEITDENPFPEANYEVADEVEGALINQYGQYKIASTTITELYMGPAPTVATCYLTFNKESPPVYPVSSDPGHFVYTRIWSRGVEQHPIALIKSRHTKTNGGSKRFATKLNAKMAGNAFQNNCINYDAFNSNWKGEKMRKRMRVKAWDTGIPAYFDWLYFHTGHATGSFTVRGNAVSLAY